MDSYSEQEEAISNAAKSMELALPAGKGLQLQLFVAAISHLMANDFNRLVALLYRMDVSESKLRSELTRHPDTDSAAVIAALVIERELRKLKSRREFRRDDIDISEEDRW